MLRVLSILVLVPLALTAADWHRFRHGQFEVLSHAGVKPGRELMVELVQLRYTVGELLGRQDIEAVWPFRIVVFSSAGDARGYSTGTWRRRRDAWTLGVVKGKPWPLRRAAQFLLEAGSERMPGDVEEGLLDVLSTLQVEQTRITLGIPPPSAKRTKAWARVHLLTVNPKYSGRVRVLFANLQQGADWHTAYRNAFESTPDEIDAEVEDYLAAGEFPTRVISGAPVSTRDFSARDYDDAYIETALADLKEGEAAREAYAAIAARQPGYAAALEGLGQYAEAARAGSRSALCWVEFGRSLEHASQARGAWERAAKLNPRWAEPYILMAGVDTNLVLKIRDLKKATELEPRNTAYWQQLAEAYLEAKDFSQATQAWGGAMRNAATVEERERFYQDRLAVEEKRGDRFTAERRERLEARQVEQRRMREEWRAMIERNRAKSQPGEAGAEGEPDVVEWWDDPRPKEKVWGQLTKVDCIGGVARLVIEAAGGETTQVLVKDPGEIVLIGGDREQTLGCGPQNPPRPVAVEYYEDPDDQMKTAGEAAVIEFR